MASFQERLMQIKREPLDKWSIREQLCLSFAVAKVGDQNWMSVSRSLKPFGEGRPADWFHQKNCAAQYGALLENLETPKRKKRASVVETLEPPSEIILNKLIQERMAEMKVAMDKEKAEYKMIQDEITLLKSGTISEEQLDLMCKQIDEEEQQKENEALAHAQWLKEREVRKAELERAWRPTVKINVPSPVQTGQKRKASESIDLVSIENDQETKSTPETPAKTALSPLLTSLLKSPSHPQNVATSSILHSAITSNQRPTNSNTNTNPTIASLLNSSTSVQVSPGIQQLVSTAIAQGPTKTKETIVDLLENSDGLPNLAEDIENTILSAGDGELPEIKNEEVDVIISDLIEHAEIVTDPETHLLDGDDIISNLESELEELDNKEKAEKAELEAETKKQKIAVKQLEMKPVKEPEIDPFEFQEDPEFEVKLTSRSTSTTNVPAITAVVEIDDESPSPPIQIEKDEPDKEAVLEETEDSQSNSDNASTPSTDILIEEIKEEPEPVILPKEETISDVPSNASVETVEVIMEEEVKELETSLVQDVTVQSATTSMSSETYDEPTPTITSVKIKDEPNMVEVLKEEERPEENATEEIVDITESSEIPEEKSIDVEKDDPEVEITLAVEKEKEEPLTAVEIKDEPASEEPPSRQDTFTPEFTEDIFDDNIEVTKIDKAGKAKRDYSRTKKKDEDFDLLLAVDVEQAVNIDEDAESSSEQGETKKPEAESTKLDNEQSHSPWTEEEEQEAETEQEQEQETRPHTRRYSTPATPIDSVPNSPASSHFEDDREYRSWKKSVMLVYSRLANHKYASLFQKPITNEQAPGYHNLIMRPVDLSTIKKNVESGALRTTAEFKRDVLLMFNNAIMYNKTDDTVFKMTSEIQAEAVEQIKILLQAQADTPAPARRETRTSEGPGSKRKRDSESLQVQSKSKKRKED